MKITKRQLKRIVKEEKEKLNESRSSAASLPTEDAVKQIERILNSLWDAGLDNRHLIDLLETIIGDIKNGFIGEPS